MSNKLVPIAISSQLDITGNERIHAAPYVQVTRSVYIPPPVPVGTFMAVGDDGNVAISSDGKTWTLVPTSPFGSSPLQRVALCNGHWITASATTGTVYVSDDEEAQTWQSHSLPAGYASFNILPPAYAFGKYFLGLTSEYVYTSDDTVVWTKEATGAGGGGGSLTSGVRIDADLASTLLFVNYDGQYQSTNDGVAWTTGSTILSPGSDIRKVIHDPNNEGLIAVGSDFSNSYGMAYDGSLGSIGLNQNHLLSVAAGNSIYMAAQSHAIYTSPSPAFTGPWTLVTNPFGSAIIDLTYGLGVWVAAGGGNELAWSDDDGITWNSSISPFTSSYSVNALFFSGDAT